MRGAFEPTANIGGLRHKALLQTPESGQDASGEPIAGWTTIARVWAQIQPLTGRELFNAQQIFPESNTLITIRYRRGMKTTMRIVGGDGTPYDIVDIGDIDTRHRIIELTAIERPEARVT